MKLNFFYLFSFGLPLIVHQLSLYSKGQLDRLIIISRFTYEELAIYTAGFQVASVISVVLMSLNKALLPYFFEALSKNSIGRCEIVRWFSSHYL